MSSGPEKLTKTADDGWEFYDTKVARCLAPRISTKVYNIYIYITTYQYMLLLYNVGPVVLVGQANEY